MSADSSPVLTFGKFKGRSIRSLLNTPEGISYVRWLASNNNNFGWRAKAKAELKRAGL